MKTVFSTLILGVVLAFLVAPLAINVPQCSAATIEFTNPLTVNNVSQFAQRISNALRGMVVILAILFITIGGVMYITSAGNPAMTTLAKKAVTSALIGLAIVVAAPAMLREVYVALGGASSGVAVDVASLNATTDLKTVVTNVLNFLLSIVGTLAMVGLVIGSLMYLTSMGSQKQIDTGKAIIKYSLIGVAIAFGSLVLVQQVQVLIGAVPVAR